MGYQMVGWGKGRHEREREGGEDGEGRTGQREKKGRKKGHLERFQEVMSDLEEFGGIGLRSFKREERLETLVSLRFQRRWRYQDED